MTVQLRDEAARVLFSPRLEDKLRFAPDWTDQRPGPALASPMLPGRPSGLGFSDRGTPFPKGRLDTPEARRRTLHFFANHELLALEIMALMLLRFPEAPDGLRRALAVTLQEEQQHLALYIERLGALGGHFGEAPVNGFFWRCFRELPDLAAYFAGMSLTFEQANLDFSLEFRDRFRKVGDQASAEVMQQVLEDEIRHVRLGRIWLGKQARGSDLWRAYQANLPPPLTPRRARGRRLYPEPRRAAGLPDRFVEQIALASQSRGRVPDCWYLGPMDDSSVARSIARDLAPLATLLAPADDLVHVDRMPALGTRRAWFDAGLEPRQLRLAADGGRARRWRGWGLKAPPGLDWAEAPSAPPLWQSKRFGLRMAQRLCREARSSLLAAPGRWCSNWSEVEIATCALGSDPARWKQPRGAAGRGQRVIRMLGDADRRWAEAVLRQEGGLLVEAQQEVLLELSLDPRGGEALLARVDAFGRFLGHELQGAGPALAHHFGRRTDAVLQLLRAAEGTVAQGLVACGHRELAAIDALVVRRRSGELALRLPSEVNVRPSFGHIARALKRKLAPGARGAHFVVSQADARRRGFASLQELSEVHPSSLKSAGWRRGVLWTTDPKGAEHAALLVVRSDEPGTSGGLHPVFDWLDP
ncbi:MAG: DUF455 family protein [Myxococcota bacterium]